MALLAHQAQGSYLSLHSRPQSRSNKQKLSHCLASRLVHRANTLVYLNNRQQWRIQPIVSKKVKSFKVSSFKGNSHSDDEQTTHRVSRLEKSTIQLSYSEEREETLDEPSDVTNNKVVAAAGDQEVSIAGSLAIQRLFKKWLALLRTQASVPTKEEICEDKQDKNETEIVEARPVAQSLRAGNLLKAMALRFWALDATLKFPLLIFPPGYFAVKLVYGAEVVQELKPLWVLGPLILALYIQMVRGLCFLYSLCFKLTMKFVINIPNNYKLLVSYIGEGKLNAHLQRVLWQPVEVIKSMNHKDFILRLLKQLKEWATEKQLDYVESVWPYYCRTIRFLKKANLI